MRSRFFIVGMQGGAAADTTAPSVTGFAATSPSDASIPITTFTASEAGVSYLITESSTPPLAGAAGWAAEAPTTYTTENSGTVTLYPWVKDSSGNVSSVYGSPASVVVALAYDTFTDTDTTNLSLHDPDVDAIGGGWQIVGGACTIVSNQARWGTTGLAVIDVNNANVTIDCDMVTPSTGVTGGMGVCARVQDVNNYWYVDVTVGVTPDNFRIVEVNASSHTVRASVNIPGTHSTTYAIHVTLNGNVITATLDGANEITYTSSFLNDKTKHGIRGVFASSVPSLNDNLVITGL